MMADNSGKCKAEKRLIRASEDWAICHVHAETGERTSTVQDVS